jgi:flagellar basal body-associated protein FliL
VDTLWLTLAAGDPQQQVGRAFLLLVVLIIVGVAVVLGLVLAGFAHFARTHADRPKRRDRYPGVDAWAESARRTAADPDEAGDEEDWEADEDDAPRR